MLDSIKDDLVKIVHGTETHHAVMFAASGTGGGLGLAITSAVPEGKNCWWWKTGIWHPDGENKRKPFTLGVVRYQIDWGLSRFE